MLALFRYLRATNTNRAGSPNPNSPNPSSPNPTPEAEALRTALEDVLCALVLRALRAIDTHNIQPLVCLLPTLAYLMFLRRVSFRSCV